MADGASFDRDRATPSARARASLESDNALIERARRGLYKSIVLLDRTAPVVHAPVVHAPACDATELRLAPPLVVSRGDERIMLETVHDLIDFVRREKAAWRPLRDEIFVAAALPSPARMRAIRALAFATLQAAGLSVT